VTFRRLAVVLALVAAGAVAAFAVLAGREAARDVGPPVADPFAEALAFAPAAAPVVAVLVTDRESPARRDLAGLGRRFPAAELARAQVDGLLRDRVGLGERDLRPLLGNPAIAWASRVDALADGGLSWVATDGARLEELLEERAQAGRLRPLQAERGFTRYAAQDVVLAVRGQRLVAAPDERELGAALARHAGRRGGLSRDSLDERRLGTAPDSLLTVLAEARPLVAQVAGPAVASGVPWLRALRRAALRLDAGPNGLVVRARLETPAGTIRPQDLPIARGPQAPVPRGRGALTVGVRAARQTVAFARQVAAVTNPADLRRIDSTLDLLRRYADIDVQSDLIDRLTGTTTFTTDATGDRITARGELADPRPTVEALERLRTLSSLGPLADLAGIDTGGLRVEERAGRFVVLRDDVPVVVLAVRGRVLVASNDPRVDVDAVAAAPPLRLPSPQGPGALQGVADRQVAARTLLDRLGLPAEAALLLTGLGAPALSAQAELDRTDLLLRIPVGS
jgi:hypothetical protein